MLELFNKIDKQIKHKEYDNKNRKIIIPILNQLNDNEQHDLLLIICIYHYKYINDNNLPFNGIQTKDGFKIQKYTKINNILFEIIELYFKMIR